jgi:hypothetical protein
MSAITLSAKDKPCSARIPGVCNHDNSTTVWCHINSMRWGAGRGYKSPNIIGLYACSACHDVIDGRVKTDHDKDFIKTCAYEGHLESLYLMVKEGIIEA